MIDEDVAVHIINQLVELYPGLVDGETEINGADLIETISSYMDDFWSPDTERPGYRITKTGD